MKTFKVKLEAFKTTNRGGEKHLKIHQPELQRQQMLDKTENLLLFYTKLVNQHHKQRLRKASDIDGEQTQAWHYKHLSKNLAKRRHNPSYLIYEADVLRHNNLLEDLIKQLDKLGNSKTQLLQIITDYWIDMMEDKPLTSVNLFHKLTKSV